MTKHINPCEIPINGNGKKFNKVISGLTIVLAIVFLGSLVYGMTLVADSDGPLDKNTPEEEQINQVVERNGAVSVARAKKTRAHKTASNKHNAVNEVNLGADTTAPIYNVSDYNANYAGFPMPDYNVNFGGFPGGNGFAGY